jgi:6-pyruvoyltetrahydropterin/6-carboxytetrahydropterin synthase
MLVCKQIEWDMGHRVTYHSSKCRNLHGHRYKAEICLEGELIDVFGVSDEGMVIDFGDIKKIAKKHIHNVLDHGFMVWEKDKVLVDFFRNNQDQKCIVVSFVPTAENLAWWIFNELNSRFIDKYQTGLKLNSVKVWETPSSSAICTRKDYQQIGSKKK